MNFYFFLNSYSSHGHPLDESWTFQDGVNLTPVPELDSTPQSRSRGVTSFTEGRKQTGHINTNRHGGKRFLQKQQLEDEDTSAHMEKGSPSGRTGHRNPSQNTPFELLLTFGLVGGHLCCGLGHTSVPSGPQTSAMV